VKTLKLLDGVFDIYMPDFKYARNDVAESIPGRLITPRSLWRL